MDPNESETAAAIESVKTDGQANMDDIIAVQSLEALQNIIEIQRSMAEDETNDETVIISIEESNDPATVQSAQVKKSPVKVVKGTLATHSDVTGSGDASQTSETLLLHKCQFCDFMSSDREQLDTHIDEGHDPFMDNASELLLLPRRLKENDQDRYQCQVCQVSFVSMVNLRRHMKNVHGKKLCSVETTNQPVDSETTPAKYVCRVCEAHFTSSMTLQQHRQKDHGVVPASVHQCPYCSQTVLQKGSMKRHVKNKHSEQWDEYSATIQDSFKLKAGKTVTIVKIQNPEECNNESLVTPTCKQCKMEFENLTELVAHMETHSETSKSESVNYSAAKTVVTLENKNVFACEDCNITFSLHRNYVRHMTQHQNAFICFSCPYCDRKNFTQFCNLTRHVRDKHPGKSQKINKEIVQYQADCTTNLLQRDKSYAALFQCPYCEMNVTTMSSLVRHVTINHMNMMTILKDGDATHLKCLQNITCSECNVEFTKMSGLYKHFMKHPEICRFRCPHCVYMDSSLKHLNEHVTFDHPGQRPLIKEGTKIESGKKTKSRKNDLDEGDNQSEMLSKSADDSTEMITEIEVVECVSEEEPSGDDKTLETVSPVKVKTKRGRKSKGRVEIVSLEEEEKKKEDVISPSGLTGHQCPHCSVQIKRASAMAFHLKHSHNIEEGSVTKLTLSKSPSVTNEHKSKLSSSPDKKVVVKVFRQNAERQPKVKKSGRRKSKKGAKKSESTKNDHQEKEKSILLNNVDKDCENKETEPLGEVKESKQMAKATTDITKVTSDESELKDHKNNKTSLKTCRVQVIKLNEEKRKLSTSPKKGKKEDKTADMTSPRVTRKGRVVKLTYKAAESMHSPATNVGSASKKRSQRMEEEQATPKRRKKSGENVIADLPQSSEADSSRIQRVRRSRSSGNSNVQSEQGLSQSYFSSLELQQKKSVDAELITPEDEPSQSAEKEMDSEAVPGEVNTNIGEDDSQADKNISSVAFQCFQCSEIFDTQEILKQHITQHEYNDAQERTCKVCKSVFQSISGLRKHVSSKHMDRDKTYKCDDCGKAFLIQSERDRHQLKHDTIQRNRCMLCQKGFGTRKLCEEHHCKEAASQSDKTQTSEHDNQGTTSEVGTNNGEVSEPNDLQDDLAKADKREKGEGEDATPKKLDQNSEVEFDNEAHISGSEEWKCTLCEVSCDSESSLQTHLSSHSENKKTFCCIQCGEQFSFRYQLIQHKAVHSEGDALYKCAICNEGFSLIKQLDEHAKTHVKDGPLIEEEDSLNPAESEDLNPAEQSKDMTGGGVWQCPHCEMSFLSVSGLRKHLAVKHGAGRQFACEDCGKCFQYEYECVRHQKTHWTSKSNKCEICQKGFRKYDLLKNHMRIIHETADTGPGVSTAESQIEFGESDKVSVGASVPGDLEQMQCPKCPQVLSCPEDLQNHLIHAHTAATDHVKHQCTQCPVSYLSASGLRKHVAMVHRKKAMLECEFCGKQFHFNSDLKVHLTSHSTEKPFVCQVCNKGFGLEKMLRSHAKRLHNIVLKTKTAIKKELGGDMKVYRCEECNINYLSSSALWKHNLIKHDKRVAKHCCETCGKTYRFANELDTHRLIHLSEPPFSCEICCKGFTWKKTLTRHMFVHKQEPSDIDCICEVCGFLCRSKAILKRHRQRKHEVGRMRFECKVCGKRFLTRLDQTKHLHNVHRSIRETDLMGNEDSMLENENGAEDLPRGTETSPRKYLPKLSAESLNCIMSEIRQHDEDACPGKPWKCLLCGEFFRLVKYCNLHIRRYHVRNEDKPFKCKVCGAGFPRINEFKIHSRVHTNFRPFQCKLCGKMFKQGTHLKEHMTSHNSEREEQCALCSRFFTCRGALMAHVSNHSTIKPFKCPHCSKSFVQRGQLSKHLLTYSDTEEFKDKKSYMCHICNIVFNHFPILISHIETHNIENPFRCSVCDTSFPRYTTLYIHKKKHEHFTSEDFAAVKEKKRVKKETTSTDVKKAKVVNARDKLNQLIDNTVVTDDGETVVTEVWEIVEGEESADVAAAISSTGMDPAVLERAREEEELLSIAQQLTQMSGSLHVTTQQEHEEGTQVSFVDSREENFFSLLEADDHVLQGIVERQNRRANEEMVIEEIITAPQDQQGTQHQTVQYEMNLDGQIVLSENGGQVVSVTEDTSSSNTILQPSYSYVDKDGATVYVCLSSEDGGSQGEQMAEEIYTTEIDGENYLVVTESESGSTAEAVLDEKTGIRKVEVQPALAERSNVGTLMDNIITVSSTGDSSLTQLDNAIHSTTHITQVEEVVAEEYVAVAGHFFKDETQDHVDAETDKQEHKVSWQLSIDRQDEEMIDEDKKEKVPQMLNLQENSNETISDEINLECTQCNRKFDTRRAWKRHVARHVTEVEKPYSCNTCHRRFLKPSELRRHQYIHSDTRPFHCDQCNMAFRQSSHLVSHKMIHDGRRPFICKQCGWGFRTSSQMKTHVIRQHSTLRPYPCKHCDKSFKEPAALRRHSAIHSRVYREGLLAGEYKKESVKKEDPPVVSKKPRHVCDICGKTVLGSMSQLKIHRIRHGTERPYKCETCHRAFKCSSDLNEHKKVHKKVAAIFICDVCGKSFRGRRGLTVHLEKHKPSGSYECPRCKKVYTRKQSFAYHVSSKCAEIPV